jgi:DNA-binding response OmpR family regulator
LKSSNCSPASKPYSTLAEHKSNSTENFRFGDVSIDFKRAEVTKNNQPIELSAIEFKLLQFLIENRGAVHSRDNFWMKFGVRSDAFDAYG